VPCEIFQDGLAAPHAFATHRSLRLHPDVSGTIQTSPTLFTDDGLRVSFAGGAGGRYRHTVYFAGEGGLADCDLPAVDLTEGGTLDRLAFRFDQVGPALEIDIEIVWDGGFFSTFRQLNVASAGTHTVLLEDDITSACWIRVEFHALGPGSFCLTDIRTTGPGFELVPWLQDYFSVIGTPPLPRLPWDGIDGNDVVAGTVGLTVESVFDIGGNDVELEAGIAGVPSPCSSTSYGVSANAWFARLDAAVPLHLVLRFDFESPFETMSLPEPPEVIAHDGAFEIAFATHDRDGATVLAAWRHSMLFEVPEGASWRIDDVWTDVPSMENPEEFHVHVMVEPTGDPDPEAEFLQMSLVAHRAEAGGAATAVVESGGAVRGALAAIPNVTRGSTRFVRANGTDASALLDVFDVQGRRVSTLTMRDGASSWDGRDTGGARLASGVYLARVRGTGETARVTIVR